MDKETMSSETKMVMQMLFATLIRMGIKPKDLAKEMVGEKVDDYLVEFAKEFGAAVIDAMAKKLKDKSRK